MADIYGAAPVFSAGQVLSASAHLNALQNYVQAVRDDFVGVAMPFSAPSNDHTHTFAVRHKFNYLSYSYTVTDGGGEIHDGWDIGGNANGGYLMALAAVVLRDLAGRPDPVSLTAHYLSPGRRPVQRSRLISASSLPKTR